MQDHIINWGKVYTTRACARQLRLEVQHMLWWAWQARHKARLLRLAQDMPGANRSTVAITADILAQRGLLTPPARRPRAIPTRHLDPSLAPPKSGLSIRSSTHSRTA